MGSYQFAESVALSAEQAFNYLANVRNLPHYLPSMTAAEPKGGEHVYVEARVNGRTESGEAWIRVDPKDWRVEWGSEGPNDYHGELEISGDGPDRCTIRLELHTVRAEGADIEEGVRHAVDGLISELASQVENEPAGSESPDQELVSPGQQQPGASPPSEDPGYLAETGVAMGEDGSSAPVIGGLPAVDGSAWDIGAPRDERGAGLADKHARHAGQD